MKFWWYLLRILRGVSKFLSSLNRYINDPKRILVESTPSWKVKSRYQERPQFTISVYGVREQIDMTICTHFLLMALEKEIEAQAASRPGVVINSSVAAEQWYFVERVDPWFGGWKMDRV